MNQFRFSKLTVEVIENFLKAMVDQELRGQINANNGASNG